MNQMKKIIDFLLGVTHNVLRWKNTMCWIALIIVAKCKSKLKFLGYLPCFAPFSFPSLLTEVKTLKFVDHKINFGWGL